MESLSHVLFFCVASFRGRLHQVSTTSYEYEYTPVPQLNGERPLSSQVALVSSPQEPSSGGAPQKFHLPRPQRHCLTIMNVDSIPDFLAEQRNQAPEELQPLFLDFENFWERKLWHQLTDALVQFFNHADSARQRLCFYKVFILKFADKINQLKLVDLALKAATQCKGIALKRLA